MNIKKVFGVLLLIGVFLTTFEAGVCPAKKKKGPKILVRKELKDKVRAKVNRQSEWQWVATKFFPEESGMVETLEGASCKIEYWQKEFYIVMLEKCLLSIQDMVYSDEKVVAVVHQEKGKIWVKATNPKNVKLRFQVQTPQALLAIRGTVFSVKVGKGVYDSKNPKKVPDDKPIDKYETEAEFTKKRDNNKGVPPDPYSDIMIPSMFIGGGASSIVVAQASPLVVLGYTKVALYKGGLEATTPGAKSLRIEPGETWVFWDGKKPVKLNPGANPHMPDVIAEDMGGEKVGERHALPPDLVLNPGASPGSGSSPHPHGGHHPSGGSSNPGGSSRAGGTSP